jgi:putative ABC transport system ATP-binding protein
MALLRGLGRERNAAVIVVAHDERMVEGFDRVYRMLDGRIGNDVGAHVAPGPVPRA